MKQENKHGKEILEKRGNELETNFHLISSFNYVDYSIEIKLRI